MKTMQSSLQEDVQAELVWEPSVDSSRIGVAVDKGVVVLSGKVPDLSHRQAAERAVKRVKGVTAVANELQIELPSSMIRDDAQLAKAAVDALRWNVAVPDEKIRVTVSQGRVTLEGQVTAAFQRRAAVHAVEQLTGVVAVVDKIVVTAPASPWDVRKRLHEALHRYARLEAQHVTIEAADGRVVLRGKVGSWAERSLVEEAAWSSPGVTAVDNRLEVGA